MSTEFHSLACGCAACAPQPRGDSHFVVRRRRNRRTRLPGTLFGIAIVALLILFLSL